MAKAVRRLSRAGKRLGCPYGMGVRTFLLPTSLTEPVGLKVSDDGFGLLDQSADSLSERCGRFIAEVDERRQ